MAGCGRLLLPKLAVSVGGRLLPMGPFVVQRFRECCSVKCSLLTNGRPPTLCTAAMRLLSRAVCFLGRFLPKLGGATSAAFFCPAHRPRRRMLSQEARPCRPAPSDQGSGRGYPLQPSTAPRSAGQSSGNAPWREDRETESALGAWCSPPLPLAGRGVRAHAPRMFVVSEADAAAIRTVFDQRGELSAAIELRRLFPGITNTAQARECVRTIAHWKPLPVAPRPVGRLHQRRGREP